MSHYNDNNIIRGRLTCVVQQVHNNNNNVYQPVRGITGHSEINNNNNNNNTVRIYKGTSNDQLGLYRY